MSHVPYLATEVGKGSICCASLFLEEIANTPGGKIVILVQGSGTNGCCERLPLRIDIAWMVRVRRQGW
jgi:hypothetical protein